MLTSFNWRLFSESISMGRPSNKIKVNGLGDNDAIDGVIPLYLSGFHFS